jgi:hypothetical protein
MLKHKECGALNGLVSIIDAIAYTVREICKKGLSVRYLISNA